MDCLKRIVNVNYSQLRLGLGQMSSLAAESQDLSLLSSSVVLSAESKERCIANIRKMKPMRPVNVVVKQRAAVLVPLVEVDGAPHLLYTRRSLSLSSHSGQVSFPGGKEEPSDSDLLQTALRETEEELGIPTSSVDVWCEMPALSSSQSGDYSATPVVGLVSNFSSLRLSPEPGEVSSVFTVPLSTLTQPTNHGYTQFRTGSGYSLPVYHGEVPYVIWGLTAIITFQLLRALLPSNVYRHKVNYQSPVGKLK